MTLFLSSSLRLLEFATSTFAPATGSYFLATSRTVTVIRRSIDTCWLLVGVGLPVALKIIVVSPRGWFHETVPSALASLFLIALLPLVANPPDGFTPLTLKAVSGTIPNQRRAVPAAAPVKLR